ncbi:MAG: capsule assembly Wzi family protein [bacterium]
MKNSRELVRMGYPPARLPQSCKMGWVFLLVGILGLSALHPAEAQVRPDRSPPLFFDYPLTSHRFYDYLDRCQTRGDIPLQSRIRPYFQFHFDSLAGDHLSDREGRRFCSEGHARHFLAEGRIEKPFESGWSHFTDGTGLSKRRALRWLYATNHHFAAIRLEDKFVLTYQPVYGIEGIWTETSARGIRRSTAGFRLEGGISKKIHFMVDFRDHGESGRGLYVARDQLYEDRWAYVDLKDRTKSISYDISESFVQWYGRNASLSLGRGRHAWGPGQFGQLFLSSQGPPLDYARLDAVFRGKRDLALHYTFLHGILKATNAPVDTLYALPDGRLRIIDARKFLTAQRFELRPRSNLLLGFSQGVIYGDRGVELAYFTPVSFLYSVQHAQDDKDNLLLAFDASWRPVRGLLTYGEFLLDDIVVDKLFTDDARNKSAFMLGLHMAPTLWRFLDARAEWTRIRPFVYSHVFSVNTYTHWTSPLGYTLEPNSELLTGEVRATFYPVQFAVTYQRHNHGANPDGENVGGDIYAPFSSSSGSFPLLGGQLEQTDGYGVRAVLELVENFLMEGRMAKICQTGSKARVETALSLSWNF